MKPDTPHRLTTAQAAQVRAIAGVRRQFGLKTKYPYAYVAALFGVTRAAVAHIVNRKCHKRG
jgi:predicted XRE-type DNA-binding protein